LVADFGFGVVFVPKASFLGVTLDEGFLAFVTDLEATFLAAVVLVDTALGVFTVFFEDDDLEVVAALEATTLAVVFFVVAAVVFLAVVDLTLGALLGVSGFLPLTAASFLVAALGVGVAFSLADPAESRGALGASLTFPDGPLGKVKTPLPAPVLIARLILAITWLLTSI